MEASWLAGDERNVAGFSGGQTGVLEPEKPCMSHAGSDTGTHMSQGKESVGGQVRLADTRS